MWYEPEDTIQAESNQGPSNLLSSVDPSSDWVVTGCTDSAEYQVVTAFCGKAESDPSSGCNAVFEGGAVNTYVSRIRSLSAFMELCCTVSSRCLLPVELVHTLGWLC